MLGETGNEPLCQRVRQLVIQSADETTRRHNHRNELTELASFLLRLPTLRIGDHEIVTRLAFLLFRLFLLHFIVGPLKSKGLF